MKESKLLSWNAGECDNSFDPYHIQNRISAIEVRNHTLFMSIGFSANCCVQFSPQISFRHDTLFVLSDSTNGNFYCLCDCCFSIDFTISNISDTSFTTLFNGKKINYDLDPYPIYEITYKVIHGDTINRTNERGAKLGLWVTKDKHEYLDSSLYPLDYKSLENFPIWSKRYYPNGQIESSNTADSNFSWNEDGTINSSYISYIENDDVIDIQKMYYPGSKLKHHSVTRNITKAQMLKRTYQSMPHLNKTEYQESYSTNGQLEEYVHNDTIKKWNPWGQLTELEYGDTVTTYYENGKIKSRCKKWLVKNIDSAEFIETCFSLEFDREGYVVSRVLTHDTLWVELYGISQHSWKWNKKKKLVYYSDERKTKPPMTPEIKKLFAIKKL